MSSDIFTSYDDEPLYNDADDFEGSVGGGSWDFVPPEDDLIPARTASSSSGSSRLPSGVPSRIIELFDMIANDNWTIARNRSFYYQAMMMADFDDHADIVPFRSYFPTYRDMNIAQLRSYFTLRPLLRRGLTPTAPLSYLFVYIYELLMKIGCKNAEDALGRLQELSNHYKASEPAISRYLPVWIRDFVVYNNMTAYIDRYFSTEKGTDTKAMVLSNRDKVSDGVLFDTVTTMSNYSITGGSLYKKHPKEVEAIVPRVIRAVAPLYEARTHHRFDTLCMGMKKKTAHPMFASAVFYDPNPVRQQEVVISPRRKFVCQSGIWTVSTIHPILGQRGGPIGNILHETDRRLRLTLKTGPKISRKPIEPDVEEAIQKVINSWMAEETEKRRPKVSVDFTKLDRIRNDAKAVRDALLTDEEKAEATNQAAATPETVDPDSSVTPNPQFSVTPQSSSVPAMQDDDAVFSDIEKTFLGLLLRNGDWQEYLRSQHIPLGVMTDGINTKAMDWIGDLILEDSDEGPKVIDDYKEDIENEIRT